MQPMTPGSGPPPNSGPSLLKRLAPDPFVLMMLGAVGLALLWPAIGVPDGPLKLGMVTKYGIAAVFFLHGANLSPSALLAGLRNWRVHLLIQSTTFILFPIFGIILLKLANIILPPPLGIGFFFLAALPSTVSSSVAMTALARGNVPVAVFNATLSSLLGMIATPALIALVAATEAGNFSVLDAMRDIALTLLLPFALGQLSRPVTGSFLKQNKKVLTYLDRSVILLIVYSSFCASTAAGVWSKFSFGQFALTALLIGLTLAGAIGFTTAIARWRRLSTEDEIAAVFAGSTKSLAAGAPMAHIMFASLPGTGMLLLPLMLYHQSQLIVCAILAQRYAGRGPVAPPDQA